MWEKMEQIVVRVNEVLWGSLLIFLLTGTGIFYTFKLRFIQLRKFRQGIQRVTSGFSFHGKDADHNGISSFQALATAVAAQVGTGNLAGAATAIASGGAGAIFWMWLSAFFGMATIYAEATLGQIYKTKVNGAVTGGPAYYIQAIFKHSFFSRLLAYFFSISCILALGFMGNAVQANSIASAFEIAFHINPMIVGIVVAILAGLIFFGGTKRIASVTEKVVPLMAGMYIIICLLIIAMNYVNIFPAIRAIFVEAFTGRAALGGAVGITVQKAMRYGIARGLFSNEAGMGSTPHAHAIAKVNTPVEQGDVAIITVFIDTFVVLTATAMVILTSGLYDKGLTGIELTQAAFQMKLGYFGSVFIAVALFFFALSTIIGWYFFGEANIKYLFHEKAHSVNIYRILVMLMIVFGSMQKVGLIWEMADMLNGFMVLPNLIALLLMSSLVKVTSDRYEKRELEKKSLLKI